MPITLSSSNVPTGAFATGAFCDDYAWINSDSFTHKAGAGEMFTYTIFNSGAVSGINYRIQVSNDPNENVGSWYLTQSGTILTCATTGATVQGYGFSRIGLRIDISGGTPISGFAWVM